MDYEKKYKEITEGFFSCVEDVSDLYPDCDYFEKCVLAFRKANWTFGNIQKALGMPSKKSISAVLKKWDPDLTDNSKKKVILVSKCESELYNLVRTPRDFIIDDEKWTFFINDAHEIVYINGSDINKYRDWDETIQYQILNQIKQQINEC